ncbi:unnamed protein product [Coregonus sp. 'balchen']|nr:unnamed protein product [Coregonus sp. 'balchen']
MLNNEGSLVAAGVNCLETTDSQKGTGHPSEPCSSLPSTARRGLVTPQSLVPLYPVQPVEDWSPLRPWFLSTQYSQKGTGHPSEPGSSLPSTASRGLATPQSLVPLYPVQPEGDWPPLRAWFLSTQYSQKGTGHPSEPCSSLPSTARRGQATPQSLVPLVYPVQPVEDWPPLRAWFFSTQYSQKGTGHPSEPGSSGLPSTASRGLVTPQSLVPLYPVQPVEDWPPLRAWFLSTQYSQHSHRWEILNHTPDLKLRWEILNHTPDLKLRWEILNHTPDLKLRWEILNHTPDLKLRWEILNHTPDLKLRWENLNHTPDLKLRWEILNHTPDLKLRWENLNRGATNAWKCKRDAK